jgi:hypothetical protein
MRRVVVRAPGSGPGSARGVEDPPLPYAQIGARLGIPAGSIGPIRRPCLQTAPSSGHRLLIHTDAQTIRKRGAACAGRRDIGGDQVVTFAHRYSPQWRTPPLARNRPCGQRQQPQN